MSPPVPTEIPLISPPIWADFNSLDRKSRVRLGKPGTEQDLVRYGLSLIEGLPLLGYDNDADQGLNDDLMAVGTVIYNQSENEWVLADWMPCTHFSELDEAVKTEYLTFRPEMGQPTSP